MSAHTPAPWHIDMSPIDCGTDIRAKDGTMLAQVVGHGTHAKEKGANADLIAAAPELLAALREALREVEALRHLARHELTADQWSASFARAERWDAAIAKVEVTP